MTREQVTRLAPSPTGALHLGNARTFLVNWAVARQRGWRILLRIEDLDTPRTKRGADAQAIEDLKWLGLDWDEGPVYQARDLTPYRDAVEALSRDRLVYPCLCTRTDIEAAASAPHGDEHERRYPGTCRDAPTGRSDSRPFALRLRVDDSDVEFTDEFAGPQRFNVQQTVGDFVVFTKAQLPSYQLAVVVDDERQGVTDIIRGDDLLPSTARQMLLRRALRYPTAPPRYYHLPLVVGSDGRRLAKRHGDSRLASYRDAGVAPWRVVGLLAFWSGVTDQRCEMNTHELAQAFRFDQTPRNLIRFTPEDHRWLLDA